MGQPAIVATSLRKSYGGQVVVDDLSFDVAAGEVFALLGPNGAGKTTTVEILEGYRSADAGTARVLGLDPVRDGARLKPRIGLMLQQGGIYQQMTPIEALTLFAAFYERSEEPERMVRMLELEDARRTRYRHLSGGQKQRLDLGLALIGRPEVVFLDEPTTSMDPRARRATWAIVRALRGRGVTTLLTTHFMDEAEHLATRVGIMNRGRLVALDTPDRLRRDGHPHIGLRVDPPLSPSEVARLLGIPDAAVRPGDSAGRLVADCEASPARLASFTRALDERGALLIEWHCGGRSLEDAYLALTGQPPESSDR